MDDSDARTGVLLMITFLGISEVDKNLYPGSAVELIWGRILEVDNNNVIVTY